MFIIRSLVVLLVLAFGPALADEQAVTYIDHNGRFIELTTASIERESDIAGAMLGVESDELANSANYTGLKNDNIAVVAWVRDGDWCVVHYLKSKSIKRFPLSVIKTEMIDRPWINGPASSLRPDPA